MSDEPEAEPAPAPPGVAPSGGRVLAGFLLILFGLCLFLAGGGCTIFWIAILAGGSSWGGSEGPGLFLVSLAVAGLGVFGSVKGVKMLRWRAVQGAAMDGADEPSEP